MALTNVQRHQRRHQRPPRLNAIGPDCPNFPAALHASKAADFLAPRNISELGGINIYFKYKQPQFCVTYNQIESRANRTSNFTILGGKCIALLCHRWSSHQRIGTLERIWEGEFGRFLLIDLSHLLWKYSGEFDWWDDDDD